MQLIEGEVVLRIFHHHITPFLYWLLKVIIVYVVIFLLLYLFQDVLSTGIFIALHFLIIISFSLIMFYKSVVYWLDKLYVTNRRIIYVNWTSLFNRNESEAMLNDIQDIQTREQGMISYFKFFDYGTFTLETAAAKVTLTFDQAPDPEGIRQYIYHIRPQ